MSPPPLTRLLADVERVVGARLFERTTRRLELTPTGDVFVAEAKAVLARAEAAMDNVRAAIRRQSGQLRLTYTPLALQTVLPQIIARLREREHDVSVDLVELTGEAQRDALHNGEADMGFADEPLEAVGFANLLLHREPLQLVLPEDHPRAKGDAVTFADLANETLILHTRRDYPLYYDRVISACRETGFAPTIHHREERQNCLALVTAGRGLLLSPARFRPDCVTGLRWLALKATPAALAIEVWAVVAAARGSDHLESLREIVQATARSGDAKETSETSLLH